MKKRTAAPLSALLLAGCGSGMIEVDHPFYLGELEGPDGYYLFRCMDKGGQGCAVDGLPGPGIVAAGADDHWIVVKQIAPEGVRYYWFGRKPETETSGWGLNPEEVSGPKTEAEYLAAKPRAQFPELTIQP